MQIVSRTPTPPPLEKRDVTKLDHNELKEMQKRLLEFTEKEEAQKKIKQEKQEAELKTKQDAIMQVKQEISDREAGLKRRSQSKRKTVDGSQHPRKKARPTAGSMLLELDDSGTFVPRSTSALPPGDEKVVVELD